MDDYTLKTEYEAKQNRLLVALEELCGLLEKQNEPWAKTCRRCYKELHNAVLDGLSRSDKARIVRDIRHMYSSRSELEFCHGEDKERAESLYHEAAWDLSWIYQELKYKDVE